MPVEVDGVFLFVVLEEEYGSLQVRHVRGAEEQAQGSQVASEQPALRLAFVDDLVAWVGHEVAVLLVLVPGVIAPVVGRLYFEGLLPHETPLEVLPRVVDAEFHAEGREMRSRVGYEAGPGVDRRSEGRNVRETAQDLGVRPDQIVVQICEQPVAVVAAEGGEHGFDPRVGERLVQIGDPRLYRGGIEAVYYLGVGGERETQAECFEPVPC